MHHNMARLEQETERDDFELGCRCGGIFLPKPRPFVQFWVKSVDSAISELPSRQQTSVISVYGSCLVGCLGAGLVLEAHSWGGGPLVREGSHVLMALTGRIQHLPEIPGSCPTVQPNSESLPM